MRRPAPPGRTAPRRAAESSGTRITCSATTAALRSCASLTAVATISSPISPSFIGTRIFENSPAAAPPLPPADVLEQAGAAAAADEEVDDYAGGEPDRAAVARAECVAMAATKIAVVASAPITVGSGTSAPRSRIDERNAEGTLCVRLREPELDDRELGGGECHEDAEAEEAREEPHRVRRELASRGEVRSRSPPRRSPSPASGGCGG